MNDITVSTWQEYSIFKTDKYDGKPVFHQQELLSNDLLGDKRTVPNNWLYLRKHELNLYDSYFSLGISMDGHGMFY